MMLSSWSPPLRGSSRCEGETATARSATQAGLVLRQETGGDVAGQTGRAPRRSIEAAPCACYLGQNFLTAFDDRGEESASTLHLFGDHVGHDQIVKEGRTAIFDLMAERDPQMPRDRFRWGDLLPVTDHSLLHPFEIPAIVDMTHVFDLLGKNADGVMIGFVRHCRIFHLTYKGVNEVIWEKFPASLS